MNPEMQSLAERILSGERRALAKAITLLESTLPKDRRSAADLLHSLPSENRKTIRIGISGVPGAGKSTFIESFGLFLISLGKKVAVLAIDPSSPISGGSILGDKTRMPELTQNENAFIRPSPSKGSLGGIAARTRETILLCEAAGFDVILVETVGVGQSEVAVSEITDFFLVLLIGGAGDELQGIKKGIMEMADLILINKADNTGKFSAENAKNEVNQALHYIHQRRPYWRSKAHTISALMKIGLEKVWEEISAFCTSAGEDFYSERKNQDRRALWNLIQMNLKDRLTEFSEKDTVWKNIEQKMKSENLRVDEAAELILDRFLKSS